MVADVSFFGFVFDRSFALKTNEKLFVFAAAERLRRRIDSRLIHRCLSLRLEDNEDGVRVRPCHERDDATSPHGAPDGLHSTGGRLHVPLVQNRGQGRCAFDHRFVQLSLLRQVGPFHTKFRTSYDIVELLVRTVSWWDGYRFCFWTARCGLEGSENRVARLIVAMQGQGFQTHVHCSICHFTDAISRILLP